MADVTREQLRALEKVFRDLFAEYPVTHARKLTQRDNAIYCLNSYRELRSNTARVLSAHVWAADTGVPDDILRAHILIITGVNAGPT
jgi:hypothetical protein